MNTIDVKNNFSRIYNDIRTCEAKSGRKEGSVCLLAVSKFHPAQSVLDAIAAGQRLFGENRVQEAFEKFPPILEKNPSVDLHLIGTLQKNKAAHAVQIASCVESVDRLDLIKELEKQCAKIDKKIAILFEMHTGEASKSGYQSADLIAESLSFCAEGGTPHIIPAGFMTMAPFTDDERAVHASFALLRTTAEKLRAQFPQFQLNVLSMGMSGDFKIAIEEGSTEVRIGTALFGEREYPA